MHDLSLNILDIVENSINAKATRVKILIEENIAKDKLCIAIIDNGMGMDREIISKITDPFVTTRNCRRVGLGLPLLKTKAKLCHGDLTIDSRPGEGTTVKIIFQYGNIDRPPLGDITSTLMCIIAANPDLDIVYQHNVGEVLYQLDTREVKRIIGKCYFKRKDVLTLISQDIKRGLSHLGNERKKTFKKIYGYLPKINLI